ncbi:hypothetical protein ACP4OV_016196 [Aristida adscensionis]
MAARSTSVASEDDYELSIGQNYIIFQLLDEHKLSFPFSLDDIVNQEHIRRTEQKKQAAADVLFHYSQFVMVCIGEGVRPTDLRLHLMKEVSGMPTSLKEPQQAATSPDSSGEPSSSGTMKEDKNEIS